ncbi:MAG TPA: glycosyltransferase [Candidatus Acidoferrum sp.]|nr:glycosyltransferase [Candidatus Acidoferrum sp.]
MAKSFASVLIDTYNHERFIEQAIVSVLEQDFPEAEREIIVVDDGSTDRTPEIVRKFEPRLRLLRKENGGQASAFNAGIPECQGEIVAFLDGDDWWEKRKLSVVAGEFAAYPQFGTIGHGIFEVDEAGRQITAITPNRVYESRLRTAEEARDFLQLRSYLGTSRFAARRGVLAKALPLPSDIAVEADEFLAGVTTALSGARVLTEPLTNYRLHSGNLFQFAEWDAVRARRKYTALAGIVRELPARLAAAGIAREVTDILTRSVGLDATRLRLALGEGWPWETVRVERESRQQAYVQSTIGYRLFHAGVLGVAALLPPHVFYRFRRWYSARGLARVRQLIGTAVPVPVLSERKRPDS